MQACPWGSNSYPKPKAKPCEPALDMSRNAPKRPNEGGRHGSGHGQCAQRETKSNRRNTTDETRLVLGKAALAG